jgi:hypothetical protein
MSDMNSLMKGVMCLTRVGLWVEEVSLNGECIILVRDVVSVVLSPSMSRFSGATFQYDV